MIVFVGDKPSAKNVDPDVPFVGTQSYKNLLLWIWTMDVNINEVSMVNRDYFESPANRVHSREVLYVALGKEAANCLADLGYSFFELPHPSPRNRKLNDKKFIATQLKECSQWLRRETL